MAGLTLHPEQRALLEAAGYVWQEEAAMWSHPTSLRCLDGRIATGFTRDQLIAWINDGRDRRFV